MNNKVLVTGGSGFIGSNFISTLIKKKYFVINLDYLSYASTPDKFKNFYKNTSYKFIKNNIKNNKTVEKIFKENKIDGIFNFASQSHVDRSINSPKKFIMENISSNLSFIDQINFFSKKKIFNGRLINISTDEVYGNVEGNASNEYFPLLPNSPYASSKASVDLILRSYNKTFGLPFINLRCCNNYGPFQFPEKFIPTIILNLMNGKKIPIYGKGQNLREWIFVDDFCSAIEIIFKKGKNNNIYNVGSQNRITNFELIKKIKKIFEIKFNYKIKKNYFEYVKDRPGHDFSYKINSNKIREELNWNAKINFDYGLEKTIRWFMENKSWIKYTKNKYRGERLGQL